MSYQRFSTDDVAMLREELVLQTMDSWQAGERLEIFLVEQGFGVSKPEAQRADRRSWLLAEAGARGAGEAGAGDVTAGCGTPPWLDGTGSPVPHGPPL